MSSITSAHLYLFCFWWYRIVATLMSRYCWTTNPKSEGTGMCCRTSSHLCLYHYYASLMLIYYDCVSWLRSSQQERLFIFRILYVISKRAVCLWFLSSHTFFAFQGNPAIIKAHVPGPWRACTSVQGQGWRLRRGLRQWCVPESSAWIQASDLITPREDARIQQEPQNTMQTADICLESSMGHENKINFGYRAGAKIHNLSLFRSHSSHGTG